MIYSKGYNQTDHAHQILEKVINKKKPYLTIINYSLRRNLTCIIEPKNHAHETIKLKTWLGKN